MNRPQVRRQGNPGGSYQQNRRGIDNTKELICPFFNLVCNGSSLRFCAFEFGSKANIQRLRSISLLFHPLINLSTSTDPSSDSLSSLSRVAGVDFNKLREKYKTLQQKQTSGESSHTLSAKEEEDLKRLNNYKICKSCLGKGTVKTIYNHMVLERDCEECDGDSIVLSQERLEEIAKGLS